MEQVGQMQIMETVQASRSRKLEICTGASKDGTHHRVSMGRQESSHRCTHIPRLATWNTRGLGVIHAVNINTPVTKYSGIEWHTRIPTGRSRTLIIHKVGFRS